MKRWIFISIVHFNQDEYIISALHFKAICHPLFECPLSQQLFQRALRESVSQQPISVGVLLLSVNGAIMKNFDVNSYKFFLNDILFVC